MKNIKKSLLVGMIAAMGSFAAQANLVNDGFETGDLTGWTSNLNGGSASVVTSNSTTYYDPATYTPVGGNYFLALSSGAQDVWQTVRQTVALNLGDTLSGWVAFDWGDYPDFFDGIAINVYNSANISFQAYYDDGQYKPNGFNGPWDTWSYTADATDTFTVEYAVRNTGDGGGPNPTYGYFDQEISQVPEPTSLALFGVALAGLGSLRRKQRA